MTLLPIDWTPPLTRPHTRALGAEIARASAPELLPDPCGAWDKATECACQRRGPHRTHRNEAHSTIIEWAER